MPGQRVRAARPVWKSRKDDFFIEADHWRLDVPRDLIEEVDRLVHDRVMAEGGRIGISTIAVSRIFDIEAAGAGFSD